MDLVILVLGLALIGLLVWVVTSYIPMPPMFVTVIYIVAAIAIILFLVRQFGGHVPNVLP